MHYQVAAALIAAAGVIIIAAAEGFRLAAGRVVEERDAELAERELLFRELQHRVGNDFAIVNSLLDLQRRWSNEPETLRIILSMSCRRSHHCQGSRRKAAAAHNAAEVAKKPHKPPSGALDPNTC